MSEDQLEKTAQSVAEGWEFCEGRDIAALLDPRPTLIVSSCGGKREKGFATILWATPISHKPAKVAIALRPTSHTMECIQMSGCFSLNVLPATDLGLQLAQVCGTRTGKNMHKGPMVPHHVVDFEFERTTTREVMVRKKSFFRPAKYETVTESETARVKVPVVDVASSWMLCEVDHIEPAGDHLLVIGNVHQAQTRAPRNDKGQLEPTDVLLCIQHDAFGQVAPLGCVPTPKPKAPTMKPPAPPVMGQTHGE